MHYVWYIPTSNPGKSVYVIQFAESILFPVCVSDTATSECFTSLAFWLGEAAYNC